MLHTQKSKCCATTDNIATIFMPQQQLIISPSTEKITESMHHCINYGLVKSFEPKGKEEK